MTTFAVNDVYPVVVVTTEIVDILSDSHCCSYTCDSCFLNIHSHTLLHTPTCIRIRTCIVHTRTLTPIMADQAPPPPESPVDNRETSNVENDERYIRGLREVLGSQPAGSTTTVSIV